MRRGWHRVVHCQRPNGQHNVTACTLRQVQEGRWRSRTGRPACPPSAPPSEGSRSSPNASGYNGAAWRDLDTQNAAASASHLVLQANTVARMRSCATTYRRLLEPGFFLGNSILNSSPFAIALSRFVMYFKMPPLAGRPRALTAGTPGLACPASVCASISATGA